MDPERERVQSDLRGLLSGEVRCDDLFVQLYASDASIYQIPPLGVVRPRSTADVVALVRYAAENRIPLHARGAGSGLAGDSLGPGLVIDFSYSMRRVIEYGENTVRIQPGVVLSLLNRELASFGRTFGPDPAMSAVTTMGSVLAIDGSGSHWLKHGSARRHVVSMQVVLSDGEVCELGRHAISASGANGDARPRELAAQVASLVERHAEIIAERQPKSLVNRCGYHLHDIVADGHVDLARLMVGSEGTLALITEATVATEPLAGHVGVALLFFDRLEFAARAALEVPPMGASACDLMDRRVLTIAREVDPRFGPILPAEAEAALLVEQQGDDAGEVRDRLNRVVDRLRRTLHLAFDARVALDAEDVSLFWQLARRVVPRLYRLKGSTRPLPFVEDIAVPPDALPDFLVRLQNVLKKHQVTATLFGHAGHGQLHVRPFLDLADSTHVPKMPALAEDLYREVLDVRGTISGEHGDGLSRTWFVREQYGPLYDVFREVKRIFDPQNIFNPGKKFAAVPPRMIDQLRPVSAPVAGGTAGNGRAMEEETASAALTRAAGEGMVPSQAAAQAETAEAAAIAAAKTGPPDRVQVFPLILHWRDEDIVRVARNCNGCGACRSQLPDVRMCPINRFAPREEASPRAKANLMRAVLTGQLDPGQLNSDALKGIADLCVHCHQCRLECPANVDIPKLMLECKAQYVATNGLRVSDWIISRLDLVSAVGSHLRSVANWAMGNRVMRWLIERAVGIAQGRKLPRLARRTFMHLAHRRRLTRPTRRSGRKVLYFVDLYANYYDVQLAEALVAVFEHNGIAVYVHPGQLSSAMPAITLGAVERARRVAAHNVRILAEAVRQGYTIVTSEPSAALALTHEYPNLLEDDDARLVAQHANEACTYLWRMHQAGRLELDFRPTSAVLAYHQPCHLKALDVGSPGEQLLRLVPGLTVERVERGCSGMAGTYGLKRENYRSSLRAGWGLISALRDPALQAGTTECSTCKMQMEQGTTKPTIHPLKVLALAYGLMPEAAALLSARGEELFVT
jgi:FAD/FMN-containing dehydrogenase/Fe-S oxidoreductase